MLIHPANVGKGDVVVFKKPDITIKRTAIKAGDTATFLDWIPEDGEEYALAGVKLSNGEFLITPSDILEIVEQEEVRPKYLCERCGGTGKQTSGLWTGKEYNSVEGVCDDCKGSGHLGEKE